MNTFLIISFILCFLINILQIINYKKIDNSILFSVLSLDILFVSNNIFLLGYKSILLTKINTIILLIFIFLYHHDIKNEKYRIITSIFFFQMSNA